MEKKEMNSNEWCEFLINLKEHSALSQKVEKIESDIAWGPFAKHYLGRPVNYIYDKLIGYKRTGERLPDMTADEEQQFKAALLKLAENIKSVAENM